MVADALTGHDVNDIKMGETDQTNRRMGVGKLDQAEIFETTEDFVNGVIPISKEEVKWAQRSYQLDRPSGRRRV